MPQFCIHLLAYTAASWVPHLLQSRLMLVGFHACTSPATASELDLEVDRREQDGSQVLVSLTIEQEPPSVFLYKHWLPMILEITGAYLAA